MAKSYSEPPDASRVLRILAIEDDPLVVEILQTTLNGFELRFATSLPTYLDERPSAAFDLILVDLCNAGDPSGARSVAALPALLALHPESDVVIQSGVSDITTMRACIAHGAARFISKADLASELPLLVARQSEVARARAQLATEILGASVPIRDLRDRLLRMRLESRADVLLVGESGTGKELCARAIHAGGPFVAVNVAAVPADLFEAEFFGSEKGAFTGAQQARMGFLAAAADGTLFLDEIQSLAPALQAKLLRVIENRSYLRVGSSQERKFTGRIVCAANQNLGELVAQGRFREDFYYRIAALRVDVPPLRARPDDIVPLFRHFLVSSGGVKPIPQIQADALAYLRDGYDWPGNVRELRSLAQKIRGELRIPALGQAEVEAALGNSTLLTKAPASQDAFVVNDKLSFDANLEALEKHLLARALFKNNSAQARESLGLTRTRFYEKLRKHGLLES